MEKERLATIYVLRDPTTNEIRYVGKTFHKLKYRLQQHIADRFGKSHRSRWINKIINSGLSPIIESVEDNISDWQNRERFWIKFYREMGIRLVNQTDGGEGFSPWTDERRLKQSERMKSIMSTDEAKNRSREIGKALGKKSKGRKTSPERNKKVSNALYVRWSSEESRKKQSRKLKEFYSNADNKNKVFSIESRRKNSERMKVAAENGMIDKFIMSADSWRHSKNKTLSEDGRRKISENTIKMNKARIGWKMSEESRKRVSIASRAMWAKRKANKQNQQAAA